MESIFSEPASQIKALVRNLSAFTTLFAPGKSWDNVRSTAALYTESRLAHLVRNKCVGFPVVEQMVWNFIKAWCRHVAYGYRAVARCRTWVLTAIFVYIVSACLFFAAFFNLSWLVRCCGLCKAKLGRIVFLVIFYLRHEWARCFFLRMN
jgi:hypothetical protein